MPKAMVIEMINSTKMVEQKLVAIGKKFTKDRNEFKSRELVEESNEDDQWQLKSKEEKTQLNAIK